MKTIQRLLVCAALLGAQLHAANTTISALPNATTLTGAEVLPIVQGGNTVKVTTANLSQGLANATISVPGLMSPTDKISLTNATSSATANTIVTRNATAGAAFGNIVITGGTSAATPTNATDIANKAYVDAAASGLSVKQPARLATTGNITLSAPQTIDGVSAIAGDRILVKNQVDATQNGIYLVAAGAWTRTTDADTGGELVTNSYIFVTAGSTNFSTGWIMTTPNPITIGASNIVWALYSSLGSIPASSITGQIISSQIANLAITTAQFAANLTPVEIVGTLPTSGNFAGRTVFLTSDNKLYRYNGSSFIATVATVDLSGTVNGTTQITSGSITAASIAAHTITATQIAAGTITATEIAAATITASQIAADTITAGQIAAGAIGTSELAVGGVTGTKIANGTITTTQIAASTITASNMNVSTLSAITANLGTVTAGSITASASISLASATNAVTIDSTGMTVGGGRITFVGTGGNPTMDVINAGGVDKIRLTGLANAGLSAVIQGIDGSGNINTTFSSQGMSVQHGKTLAIDSTSSIVGPGLLQLNAGGSSLQISAAETGSAGTPSAYFQFNLNGRTVNVAFNLP